MATRLRKTWKRRTDGQFDCRVGWKGTAGGKRGQHKFRLGPDEREAKRRDLLLRQMWDRVEELQPVEPLWTRDGLEVAMQVAQGNNVIQVQRAAGEEDFDYAQRVVSLRNLFPMLRIFTVPEYGPALNVKMLDAYQQMQNDDSIEAEVQLRQQDAQDEFRALVKGSPPPADGPTLHQALRAYRDWLDDEFAHPETGITPWGHTQKRQIETLIAHHDDSPLCRLDRGQVEQMLRYWRKRPYKKTIGQKKKEQQRVTRSSASNYLKALRTCFRWLHGSDKFDWKKPDDLDELRSKIQLLDGEVRHQITPEQLFTLDELIRLYAYGTPLDRFLILLGLNCGFGAAESASLRVQELCLRTAHSKRSKEILDFNSTERDSFIKRCRGKTGVSFSLITPCRESNGCFDSARSSRTSVAKPDCC